MEYVTYNQGPMGTGQEVPGQFAYVIAIATEVADPKFCERYEAGELPYITVKRAVLDGNAVFNQEEYDFKYCYQAFMGSKHFSTITAKFEDAPILMDHDFIEL